MSKIVYNGVELGFIQTQSYQNVPVADKDKPDMLYRETDLKVTSVLATSVVPASFIGETPQQIMVRVRHALELPRRSFLYEIAGVKMIDLPNGLDDANGPFPYGVSVELVAEASLVISWGIKVRLADCGGKKPNPILSLRWQETATIDEEWLTTYQRSGRLIVSGRSEVNPDSFRFMVTPYIRAGFIRESAHYELHENNLELAFSFRDKEQHVMPPWPAIKAKGTQSQTSSMPGAIQYGRIDLTLSGPKGTDKKLLMKKCVEIAMARAMKAGLRRNKVSGRFIAGGAVNEDLFSPSVTLTMQWMRQANNERAVKGFDVVDFARNALQPEIKDAEVQKKEAISIAFDWLGESLKGVDPNRYIGPGVRGNNELLILVAAAFRDPCLQQTMGVSLFGGYTPPGMSSNTNGSNDTSKNGTLSSAANVTKASVLTLDDKDEKGEYDDVTDGAYNIYHCVNHYTHDTGKDVLPPMKTGASGKAISLRAASASLQVEWSVKRTGGPPVLPDPNKTDGNAVFINATESHSGVELGADGVSLVYAASGIYKYKYLDPARVGVTPPVPPFLSQSVEDEAKLAGAMRDGKIIFLGFASSGNVNPFTGSGITQRATGTIPAITANLGMNILAERK